MESSLDLVAVDCQTRLQVSWAVALTSEAPEATICTLQRVILQFLVQKPTRARRPYVGGPEPSRPGTIAQMA
jgi:hypothetical protein